MIELEIALLGRPEVRWRGSPVLFRTRKALALLAYLAAEPGPHRRDELAGMLWPESEPALARSMLRTSLQHLRQALPGEDERTPPLLVAERDLLSLPRQAELWLDLEALDQAARSARAAPLASRKALLPTLEAAAGLVRGEFMQSFSLNDVPEFDHWVQAQQPVWRERAEAVFEALVQAHFESGELLRALAAARAWSAADRLNDAATRWQMQLLFALSRPAEALRLYDAHVAALAQELQAQPQPALAALAERIRRQPGLPNQGPPAPTASLLTAAVATEPQVPATPLVGRASEFANLIALLHAFRAGQPQAALIVGEAGIGKTRLAREFVRSAIAEGLDVWEARAFEAVGRVPYQVVVDALRARVERENAPDDLLADVWLAELSRLLPELRERYPDLPPPLAIGEAEAQARLFEAIARLVQALTARGPVVFFVDDIQWADTASLDLLLYLARQCAERHAPLLLLLAARAEDLPSLAGWVDSLERVLPITRLALGTLTLAHTQQWVQALAGYAAAAPPEALRPAVAAFAGWLHAETNGQPFFITETLRAMREQGLIGRLAAIDVTAAAAIAGDPAAARAALGIPSGVRDIIRTRTQRLGPPAAELLAAAAVIGQAASFEVLCAVAALDERDGLRALDELLAARLLQELEAERGSRYLITHDKIRQLTYTSASDARRRALHRRASEALATAQAPAADVAYHALAAGLRAPGARWSIAAGDQALSVFDVRRAIEHFTRARQALEGALETVDAGAYLRLARAYELNGDSALAEQTYQEALAVARATRAPALEVSALSRLAMVAIHAFDEQRMNGLLEQMLRAAEATGDLLQQAQAEWTLAQTYQYLARLKDAQVHGERALALATAGGDDELAARCLNVLGYVYSGTYQAERARQTSADASARYAALGNPAMESDSLAQLACAYIRLGQPRQALAAGRRSRQRAEAVENYWGIANGALQMAVALAELGELGQAQQTALEAVNLAQEQQVMFLAVLGKITLAAILRGLFQLDPAGRLLEEVLAFQPPESVARRAGVELCAVRALQGNWAAARQALGLAEPLRAHPLFLAGRGLWLEAEALLRAGEAQQARDYVAEWGQAVGDNPRAGLDHAQATATVLRFDDRPARAIAVLQLAERSAAHLELPGEHWQILAALALAHEQADEAAKAQAARDQARAIVVGLAGSLPDETARQTFLIGAHTQIERTDSHDPHQ